MQPSSPAALREAIDPVEAALSAGIEAIARAMTKAPAGDLVALADRTGTLARELESRRFARAGVVDLALRRERERK